jgi:hypothetical protein
MDCFVALLLAMTIRMVEQARTSSGNGEAVTQG